MTKATKKSTKKAAAKTPAKKVTKVTKVEQATAILKAARSKNKKVERKDVVKLIAKQMKCSVERASGHYQAAHMRLKK